MANITSIWDQMEYLAVNEGVANLGHGYADFEPPGIITDALIEVVKNPSSPLVHQYARRYGHLRLVKILAEVYSPILGVEIDALTNIIVTFGAQHALYCALRSILNSNDEVILFEPFFTLYDPILIESGATVIYVPLRLNTTSASSNLLNYTFDKEELKSKFNKRTKLFLLINPNNPFGKVFTRDELEFIAELCIEYNVTVISDEVYYRLVHPPHKHIPIASLPGMWERTITLGSAGKCFSVTGWRIGWCIGPENLINIVAIAHRTSGYSCQTPLQEAVAIAFEKEKELKKKDGRNYLNSVSSEIMEKLKRLEKMIIPVGMKPIMPQAGYFLVVDISNVEFEEDKTSKYEKDVQFSHWMLSKYGVSSVPMGVFWSEKSQTIDPNFIRLCCYKSDATLSKAEAAFMAWKDDLEKRGTPNGSTQPRNE